MKTHATYRCMIGDRVINRFISAAGLGISGAFQPILHTITWKDGEVVDQERADKLCDVLKDAINQSENQECSGVELLSVYRPIRPSV